MGIDILGIDIMGVDILGIDILALPPQKLVADNMLFWVRDWCL